MWAKWIVILLAIGTLLVGRSMAQEPGSRKFTPVSVNLEAAPPADIFSAIGAAGGVEFIAPGSWGRGNQIRLSFSMQNQPFWVTALQAGGIFGYTFDTTSFSPSDRRIKINLGKPIQERKMLLVAPLVIMLEPSKSQSTSIDLVTYVDPALKDWVFAGPPEITEILDAAGESLLPPERKPQIAPPAGLVARHPVQLTRVSREISSLKGSFVLLTADETEEWTIASPVGASMQERKVGDATYTFRSLRKAGRQHQLALHVKGPSDGGFVAGAYELAVGPGSIIATDSAGQPWRMAGISGDYRARQITATADYEYLITLVPEKNTQAGDITSLRWRIPRKMSNIEVPFHFHAPTVR